MNLLLSNIKLLYVLDPLALFFVILILLISLPALVYSIGYFKNKFNWKKYAIIQAITVAFIASMLLLVTTANALLFLLFWELMSLFSYFLVLTDSENDLSVGAATLYIVMTHI